MSVLVCVVSLHAFVHVDVCRCSALASGIATVDAKGSQDPKPRWGHTAFAIADGDKIVVYGVRQHRLVVAAATHGSVGL